MFNSVSGSITDPNWKSRAILDRSKKLYEWDEYAEAIKVYNQLNGLAITDKRLFNDIQIHELMLAFAVGNPTIIKSKLIDIPWTNIQLSNKLFLEGVAGASEGDSVKLRNNLNWIIDNNSFFAEGIMMAAQMAKRSGNDPLGVYNILTDALHFNPQSIKILKAYIQEAANLGFDEYVYDAEMTLQQILPETLFNRFLTTLQ
jgi:hypothetical protein